MAASRILTGFATSAFALAGCTEEAAVEVSYKGEMVSFTIGRSGAGTPPCMQRLTVSPAGADIITTPSLWEISAAEPGRCLTGVDYGHVPRGYIQSGPAPKMLPGSRNLVEVAGPGSQGGREFTMPADHGPAVQSLR